MVLLLSPTVNRVFTGTDKGEMVRMKIPTFFHRRSNTPSEHELLIKAVENCIDLPYKYRCLDAEHQEEMWHFLNKCTTCE
jgi:hypothetical protein